MELTLGLADTTTEFVDGSTPGLETLVKLIALFSAYFRCVCELPEMPIERCFLAGDTKCTLKCVQLVAKKLASIRHELARYFHRSRILYHGFGLHVYTVESSVCFHQFVESHMAMLSQGCRQVVAPDNSVS